MNLNRALFLDRDGVINVDYGHVHKKKDFKLINGIQNLIKTASKKNYKIIVITNQAGIAKGFYSEIDFQDISNYMKSLLESEKCYVDEIYFCPYHPTEGRGRYLKDSFDRKPNPGMLLKAKKDFKIDMNSSILIGDKLSDVEAGINANVKTNILFDAYYKKSKNETFEVIDDILSAINYL